MELTAERKDALTEMVNIGFGRAAGALADLTKHRIVLQLPEVTIHSINRLTPALEEVLVGEVTCVHQMFGGSTCGNAILLLDRAATLGLAELVTGNLRGDELDITGRDAITEVGNVLLNASVGAFSNLMKMNIRFTVPQLKIEQVQEIMQSVRIDGESIECAMMVRTRFEVRGSDVSGVLVILLGITFMEQLIDGLGEWSSV